MVETEGINSQLLISWLKLPFVARHSVDHSTVIDSLELQSFNTFFSTHSYDACHIFDNVTTYFTEPTARFISDKILQKFRVSFSFISRS
jgi:hypothetical protein